MASHRKASGDNYETPPSSERPAPRQPDDRRTERDVFSALGNETRYRILLVLRESDGPVCVSEIEPHLAVGQSAISRSLRVLQRNGLVSREKRGRRRYYESTTLADRLLAVLEADGTESV